MIKASRVLLVCATRGAQKLRLTLMSCSSVTICLAWRTQFAFRSAITLQKSSCAAEWANRVEMCWHFTNTSLLKQDETSRINYSSDAGVTRRASGHNWTYAGLPLPETNGSFGEGLPRLPGVLRENSCVHSCISHMKKRVCSQQLAASYSDICAAVCTLLCRRSHYFPAANRVFTVISIYVVGQNRRLRFLHAAKIGSRMEAKTVGGEQTKQRHILDWKHETWSGGFHCF